jgi:hypothetical protein
MVYKFHFLLYRGLFEIVVVTSGLRAPQPGSHVPRISSSPILRSPHFICGTRSLPSLSVADVASA